jgi:hypothetical protein
MAMGVTMVAEAVAVSLTWALALREKANITAEIRNAFTNCFILLILEFNEFISPVDFHDFALP